MRNKALIESKKAAYAARKEKEGQGVVMWIIAALIFLGIVFAMFTIISQS